MNEAVYELVAEPVQEPQAGEQQEDTAETAPEEVVNPTDLQGKPRSITLISVFNVYLNNWAFTFLKLYETLVCMFSLGTCESILVYRYC